MLSADRGRPATGVQGSGAGPGWRVRAGLLIAAALAALGAAPAAPPPPDVEALLQRLDDLYRSQSSVARIELQVTRPRATRSLRLKAWTRGEENVLVLIEAPPREAGTATLRVGENLWNYLPRIARTIRVPPSMMLGSWMGTDFTNDDLVKESSLREDFAARVERRSEAPPGWWLALTVKPGVVGRWARSEVLVSDEDLPVEERHYDRKDRLARTMRFDEVAVLGGRRLPRRMSARDQPRGLLVGGLDLLLQMFAGLGHRLAGLPHGGPRFALDAATEPAPQAAAFLRSQQEPEGGAHRRSRQRHPREPNRLSRLHHWPPSS
jgi:hypothetical protein